MRTPPARRARSCAWPPRLPARPWQSRWGPCAPCARTAAQLSRCQPSPPPPPPPSVPLGCLQTALLAGPDAPRHRACLWQGPARAASCIGGPCPDGSPLAWLAALELVVVGSAQLCFPRDARCTGALARVQQQTLGPVLCGSCIKGADLVMAPSAWPANAQEPSGLQVSATTRSPWCSVLPLLDSKDAARTCTGHDELPLHAPCCAHSSAWQCQEADRPTCSTDQASWPAPATASARLAVGAAAQQRLRAAGWPGEAVHGRRRHDLVADALLAGLQAVDVHHGVALAHGQQLRVGPPGQGGDQVRAQAVCRAGRLGLELVQPLARGVEQVNGLVEGGSGQALAAAGAAAVRQAGVVCVRWS